MRVHGWRKKELKAHFVFIRVSKYKALPLGLVMKINHNAAHLEEQVFNFKKRRKNHVSWYLVL